MILIFLNLILIVFFPLPFSPLLSLSPSNQLVLKQKFVYPTHLWKCNFPQLGIKVPFSSFHTVTRLQEQRSLHRTFITIIDVTITYLVSGQGVSLHPLVEQSTKQISNVQGQSSLCWTAFCVKWGKLQVFMGEMRVPGVAWAPPPSAGIRGARQQRCTVMAEKRQ